MITATNGPDHLKELFELESRFLSKQAEESNFWAAPFNLDNGASILSRHFEIIQRYDYPNKLKVTNSSAIINYLKSKSEREPRSDSLTRLTAYLDMEIQNNSWIEISAQAGVFVCYK